MAQRALLLIVILKGWWLLTCHTSRHVHSLVIIVIIVIQLYCCIQNTVYEVSDLSWRRVISIKGTVGITKKEREGTGQWHYCNIVRHVTHHLAYHQTRKTSMKQVRNWLWHVKQVGMRFCSYCNNINNDIMEDEEHMILFAPNITHVGLITLSYSIIQRTI